MKRIIIFSLLLAAITCNGQLPAKWEELSASEFQEAVVRAGKVCVLPLGIIEKHGPSLPLGTDLYIVREMALRAAAKEYVVVFPEFFAGQINEARHQPGTIAYSPELVWKVLEETCQEIARNGFEKIIFINGHGGNNSMLAYYTMAALNKKKNYAVYMVNGWDLYASEADREKVEKLMNDLPENSLGHAGADEAAEIKVIRPDLFKPSRAETESGENQARLKHLNGITTGLDWYAAYPNHYAGNAAAATDQLGNAMIDATVNGLVKAFRNVKADKEVPKLQKQFYEQAENPVK